MRVTKKVENYIREQVKAKVAPKYEWEKAEAERIRELARDFDRRASAAAKAAAKAVYDEAKAHGDVLEYDEKAFERSYLSCYNVVMLKDACYITSVHKWDTRMAEEVNKAVDNIIVTLELGGNKTDLDRMLSEL
jgi:hypothetical protein